MKYEVFCDLRAAGVRRSPEAAVAIDEADIYSEYFGRMSSDRDFVGIIDANGTTLQMMYHAADDTYWMELPVPAKQGSFGAQLTFDEVVDILKALPREFSAAAFPMLRFQRW